MSLIKREWLALFKNKKMLISVIAILFIPIMYSGMLIWANWDPYGQLDAMPVAIVNNDVGAELDGEKLQLGNELVDKLKENKELDFQFVDKKTGYQDLKDKKAYLLVEIPKDFSKNATTLMDHNPKKLKLKYVTNEGFNFLSAQISESAVQKIKTSLSEKITETYAETMFKTMTKMADGFSTTDKAAGKLKDGMTELDDGANTLKEKLAMLAEKQLEFTGGTTKVQDGTAVLKNGAASLANGLGQLSNAQKQLVDGANAVEDGGSNLSAGIQKTQAGIGTIEEKMNEVISGTEKIQEGSTQLSVSLQKLETGANSTANGASELKTGISNLQSQLEPLMAGLPAEKQAELKRVFAELSTGAEQLEAGNKELASSTARIGAGTRNLAGKIATLNNGQIALQTGISQLNDGTSQLASGASQLQEGQKKLREGLVTFGGKLSEATVGGQKLADGSATLADGVSQLQTGATALADGSSRLADGSSQITDGTSKLVKGTTQFKNQVNKAAKDSSDIGADDKTYNMVAAPVTTDRDSLNRVPNYGTGITPYFLSLGLFVGALISSIVFPFRDPVGIPKTAFSWFFSKWSIISVIAIFQALIASFIILKVLHVQVQNVPLFILFTILTSLSFMAIIQLLVTTLENPGRFVAVIILIFQLVTSAGTFPNELLPTELQGFNSFMPMAFSVRGFREVISTGNFSMMWQNGYVLLSYAIGCMILTLCYFKIRHKKSYSGVSE